jgi:CBS domain containing-hemolysin-like protein
MLASGTSDWSLVAVSLLAVPFLVALNGFFVAAEFALVAVRKTRVEQLIREKVPRSQAVAHAIGNLDRTIAATQLGITLASIALGYVGERALEQLFAPVFAFLPEKVAFLSRHALAVGMSFILITFLHVIFGELIPKAIALQTPDTTSLWLAGPLNLFTRVSSPVITVMNGTGNYLVRKMGYAPSGEGHGIHSLEEVRIIVEDQEEAGVIDSDQAKFVRNIFELSDKRVADVMVPLTRVAALDMKMPPEHVLDAVRQGAHTRMPVFEDTIHNIIGIVNTKDLFYLFSLKGIVVLEDALYPAHYLRSDATVSEALQLFKRTRNPMAVVRDADETILGILTLEDVLEEIVGDIEDEHDDPERSQRPRVRRRPRPSA